MALRLIIFCLFFRAVLWADSGPSGKVFAVPLPEQLKKTEYLSLKNSWKVCAEYSGRASEAEKLMAAWLERMGFSKKYDIPVQGKRSLTLSLWQKKTGEKILIQYHELQPMCTEIKIGEMK